MPEGITADTIVTDKITLSPPQPSIGPVQLKPDSGPEPTERALRGTGRTSKQIMQAPENAAFIWCGNFTHYAKQLAEHLGRSDVLVLPINSLTKSETASLTRQLTYSRAAARSGVKRTVIIDHGANLTDNMIDVLKQLSSQQFTLQFVGDIDLRPAPPPEMKLTADVRPWSLGTTGITLRNEAGRVVGILKLSSVHVEEGANLRDTSMELVEVCAKRIAQINHVAAPVAPNHIPPLDTARFLVNVEAQRSAAEGQK